VTRAGILVEQNWNAVPGGTARSINRLIVALSAYTDVSTVGIHGRHRQPPQLPLATGIKTVTVPLPGRILAETWSRVRFPSIDRWVEADVVHAPAYVLPPTQKPLVATIHDLAFVHHPEWFTPNGVAYLSRFLERVRRSDAAVIVPSGATAQDCVAKGISAERVTVIPWGIDVEAAADSEVERVRRRYSLPESFVLFVGTVEPRKNLHTLADAMATLPGHGHFEGFGLPVLEAMAQGTPVVTTQGTAPAEIAASGGLAVDTRSVSALAGALRDLMSDAAQRSELGAAGRIRAGEYLWQETARRTANVYEAVR